MARMPHFQEVASNSGFDNTATPPWLMVGAGDSKEIVLVHGAKMTLKSQDRHTANVGDNFPPNDRSDASRLLTISGSSPGRTLIEVLPPGWRVPAAYLAVRVKAPKTVPIAFHYVKDELLDKTTRTDSPQFRDGLLRRLNSIYQPQTNITFTMTGAVPLEVKTTLFKIVSEQPDVEDLRDKGEFHKLALEGDPGAEINVFFMPWPWPKGKLPGKHPDRRPTQMIGTAWACICEDGMSDAQLTVALPHMIGRLYGLPVTHDEKQSHHLMFSGRAEGDPFFDRNWNRGFIPRDLSNRLNHG
ncbi:MAG: hypothetical protein L0Z62_27400 [Gemmataceae bacterium]|nr:hypothetical protein [Gemmataceae bacterium]